jgi:phosphoserine phosphatase
VSTVPLPSWREGATKAAILDFVARVTDESGPDYVAPDDRLATFDSDGTLVPEHPRTLEELFLLDKIGRQLPTEPRELSIRLPDFVQGFGHFAAAWPFRGYTPQEYEAEVDAFLSDFAHPILGRPMDGIVYQPMLELIRYLEAHGFTVAIVSASGMSFVRAWAPDVLGLDVDQVVGTTVAYRVRKRGDEVRLERGRRLIGGVTTSGRKPSHVQQRFGRMPLLHAGNSLGDAGLLDITADNLPGIALAVMHDDADREFVYTGDGANHTDLVPMIAEHEWTPVSIRDDWAVVFPLPTPKT